MYPFLSTLGRAAGRRAACGRRGGEEKERPGRRGPVRGGGAADGRGVDGAFSAADRPRGPAAGGEIEAAKRGESYPQGNSGDGELEQKSYYFKKENSRCNTAEYHKKEQKP